MTRRGSGASCGLIANLSPKPNRSDFVNVLEPTLASPCSQMSAAEDLETPRSLDMAVSARSPASELSISNRILI